MIRGTGAHLEHGQRNCIMAREGIGIILYGSCTVIVYFLGNRGLISPGSGVTVIDTFCSLVCKCQTRAIDV